MLDDILKEISEDFIKSSSHPKRFPDHGGNTNRIYRNSMAKIYRLQHQEEIKRKRKKYTKKVSMGIIHPRQRVHSGHQYLFQPGI